MRIRSKRRMEKRLGKIMLDSGLINEDQLCRALEIQTKNSSTPLGKVLIDLGYIGEIALVGSLADQYYLSYLPLDRYEIDPEVSGNIPYEIACRRTAISIDKLGRNLTVAMSNPLDNEAVSEIETVTGCNIHPTIATTEEILSAINRCYGAEENIAV